MANSNIHLRAWLPCDNAAEMEPAFVVSAYSHGSNERNSLATKKRPREKGRKKRAHATTATPRTIPPPLPPSFSFSDSSFSLRVHKNANAKEAAMKFPVTKTNCALRYCSIENDPSQLPRPEEEKKRLHLLWHFLRGGRSALLAKECDLYATRLYVLSGPALRMEN